MAHDASVTVAENGSTGITLSATDHDDTQLTFSFTGPSHGSVTGDAPNLTYTPDADYYGPDSITFQVGDGHDGHDSNVATITIKVNAPPIATSFSITVDQGVGAPATLSATDPNDDSLTYTIIAGPAHGSLSGSTPNLTYTSDANYNGPDSFTYLADDGQLDSIVATVSIHVTGLTAVDDGFVIDVNANLTGNVLANDSYSESGALTASLLTDVNHGSLALDADGSFVYSPAADFHGLDFFTYTAAAGNLSATATVTIVVDDAPVTEDDAYTADEDTPLVIDAPGVLANDADPDGDSLIARLVGGPAHGSLAFHADGSFTYTPNANFFGSDSFIYAADDGLRASAAATVTLTVNPVNDPPMPTDDAYAIDLNTASSLSIAAPGVLANDSDIDNPPDQLSASLVSGPSHGTLTLNADGSVSYTPTTGFHGADEFVYAAGDGAATTSATATIIVDHAPLAASDTFSLDSSVTPVFTVAVESGVLTNDTDADTGDTLTAVLVTNVSHGTLTLHPDGSFTYTPVRSYTGSDSFTYRASDGLLASSPATVTLNITKTRDIAVESLTSDNTDLTIEYTVSGGTVNPYSIGLYASYDGVTPNVLLQSFDGDPTVGSHTLTISPEFDDLNEDYYLVAMVECFGNINETDETNNVALFGGGTYLLYQPTTADYVRIYDGSSDDEVVSVTTNENDEIVLTVRDPGVSIDLEDEPDLGYLDINADGLISELDIDALAAAVAHARASWQNPMNRFDVTGNGTVTPLDAMELVNLMNVTHGPIVLDQPMGPNDLFLDVSGDGVFSLLDIVQVQDKLNHRSGNVGVEWQNPTNYLDANDDGAVDARDFTAIDAAIAEHAEPTLTTADPPTITRDDDTTASLTAVYVRSHDGRDRTGLLINSAGLTVSISAFGGAGDDVLIASQGNSLLDGGAGDDTLSGGLGNDYLLGGDGNDAITAGAGDDQIDGGQGDDNLSGGAGDDNLGGDDGNDRVDGGTGNDIVMGGIGDDILTGGAGDDFLGGGDGDDSLTAGAGDDQIYGDDGDDTLSGEAGDDHIDGGEGDDTIHGGLGNDTLEGSEGNDTINGNNGDDTISGGDGNDTLNGNGGNDAIYGGAGTNSISTGGQGGDSSSQNGNPPSGGNQPVIVWGNIYSSSEGTGEFPGDSGLLAVSIGITGDLDEGETASVHFIIEGMTADEDDDFLPPGGVYSGTITFSAETRYDSFYIFAIPDFDTEDDETLKITFSNCVNCTLDRTTSTATIYDDDNYGVSAMSDGDPDGDGNYPYWTFDQAVLRVSAADGVLYNLRGQDIDYDPNAPANGLIARLCNSQDAAEGITCLQPQHGSVSLDPDGSFTFTPTSGYVGLDHWQYVSEAQDERKAVGTVTIAIVAPKVQAFTPGSWAIWRTLSQTNIGAPSAWVGQAIQLRLTTEGPPVDLMFGPDQYTWTVSDEVVAQYRPSEDAAQPVPFVGGLTHQTEPTVYWIDGGNKAVHVTLKRTNALGNQEIIASATGNLFIMRPNVNVTSTTDKIYMYPGTEKDGSEQAIFQFGNVNNELFAAAQFRKVGIIFTRSDDQIASAAGNYQWVQLADVRLKRTLNPGGVEVDQHLLTSGEWLDTSYPYASDDPLLQPNDPRYRSAWDSPIWNSQTAYKKMSVDRFQARMFLMWRYGKATPEASLDSIWVPLRVTEWQWKFAAVRTGNATVPPNKVKGWELENAPAVFPTVPSGNGQGPPSQDTTELPSWKKKFNPEMAKDESNWFNDL